MEHHNQKPAGWYAPVCVPLTRRTMFLGIPFDHVMWLVAIGMVMAIWQVYLPAIVVPLVCWRLDCFLISKDEWALGQTIEYMRVVVARLERMAA